MRKFFNVPDIARMCRKEAQIPIIRVCLDSQAVLPAVQDASPNPVSWANFARVIPYSFLICRISSGDRTPRCRHIAPCLNRSASSSRYSKSQASHRQDWNIHCQFYHGFSGPVTVNIRLP